MSSYVTDRPVEAHKLPEAEEELVKNAVDTACTEGDPPNRPVNVPSISFAPPPPSITPELLRSYPKALPRKKLGGRPRGKSILLTDTPEMEAILTMKKKKYEKCDKTDSKAQEEEN
ncbi:hypothetical protein QE152_g26722 [Popillia japonica]|uniref:Uncharacterized protein n=1 Tax=Popillia japonica TaxID=7064 RepID=A0AAW1JW25_POPJA